MRLLKLKAKNLLSYAELNIEFQNGLYLIRGYNHDEDTANGSGKSAIIDIICWALYGTTPRDIKADEIIKWGCDSAEADIEFESRNSRYRIVRSRSPNLLELYHGDVKVVSKDAKELQDRIGKVIGLSLNTFLHSVYFRQDSSKADEFVFANDTAKKEILTELLELGVFDECLDKAKELQKHLQKSATTIMSEFEVDKAILESKKVDAENLKASCMTFEERRNRDFDAISATVRDIQHRIQSTQSNLSALVKPESTISALREKITTIVSKLLPQLSESLTRIDVNLSGARLDSATATSAISDLTNKILRLKSMKGDVCDNCEQTLNVHDHQARIAKYEQDIEAIKKKLPELTTNIENLSRNRLDIATKSNQLTAKMHEFENEITKLKNQYDVDKSSLESKFKAYGERLQELEIQRQEIQTRTNDYTELLANTDAAISRLEVNQSERKLKLVAIKEQLQAADELVNIFGRQGIRAMVFKTAMAELETIANTYLSDMFAGDIKIEFRPESVSGTGSIKQSITTVLYYNGKETSINTMSGGQRRRLILATNFALSRLIGNRFGTIPNFMCLDECFTGLDNNGKDKVMGFLNRMKSEKDFIFVIDHQTEFQEAFDEVYTVSYKDGKSTLENGYNAATADAA